MSFLIPIFQMIDIETKGIQAICVSNTRELSIQTFNEFEGLTEVAEKDDLSCLCLEEEQINFESNVIIGTPGKIGKKLKEGFEKGIFDKNKVKFLVIDEADSMIKTVENKKDNVLTPYEQCRNLLNFISKDTQVILVSATHPGDMERYEKEFLGNEYSKILVHEDNIVPSKITQFYMNDIENKNEIILKIFNSLPDVGQTIVFVNQRATACELAKYLMENDVSVCTVFKGMDVELRDKIVKSFKEFKFRFLVTTDLLARGIDVLPVNFVINYDTPLNYNIKERRDEKDLIMDVEDYIHRIGRTGRFGFYGLALTFTKGKEYEQLILAGKKYNFIPDELTEDCLEEIDSLIKENHKKNKERRNELKIDESQ